LLQAYSPLCSIQRCGIVPNESSQSL
jgi:hypothetical protein